MAEKADERRPTEKPTYWGARLIAAMQAGDAKTTKAALEHLRRAGFPIKIGETETREAGHG